MMLYFLLLIGFLAYTSAASVPSTVNTERDLTLSGPAQSNSSVAESDIWLSYCTKTERWSLPELNPDDCSGVLDYFYIETVDKDHRGSKEFRSPKAKKKAQAKTQWTPRKYTFGTCTLAIVMVADFPDPASLPGGAKRGQASDMSTYYNLWRVAENVIERCVQGRGEMGWQATGYRYSIGVFIWSTGSEEDRLIEADEPRFTFPTPKTLVNGSAADV